MVLGSDYGDFKRTERRLDMENAAKDWQKLNERRRGHDAMDLASWLLLSVILALLGAVLWIDFHGWR